MKKLLLCLLVLLLCACSKNVYKELGYSKKEIKVIEGFKLENQRFFNEHNEFLSSLLNNENIIEDNLELYIEYHDLIKEKDVVALVNSKVLREDNYERVKDLTNIEGYKEENLEKYLSYYKRNDSLLVKYVNEDNMDGYYLAFKLSEDKYFVERNLDLYLKYYDQKDNIRDLIEYINSKVYLPPYEDEELADVDKYGYQVLVNKYYKLPSDYEPDDLVKVESNYGVGYLRQQAYEAYKKMQDDAYEQGISMYITSPYRSYNTQYVLYNRYLNEDPVEVVDTYSARPGNSEHQLGLAVDILTPGYNFGTFNSAPAAQWLEENAHKYGFIFRYPAEKIDITGYKYEPWHYRYLGDIATSVYESGITYDEYFEKYIKDN